MSTQSPMSRPANVDDPLLDAADAATLLEQFASGRPIDPAVAERVHAQAEQITEEIRRTRGLVDDETFQALLDDDA